MIRLFTRITVPLFLAMMIIALMLSLFLWSWELLLFGITLGLMAFTTLFVNHQLNKHL